MSIIPPDHLLYLQRRPFVFGYSTDIFPVEEIDALAENGNWLEALVAGTIKPASPEQEHFLKVDREEEEPATVCERTWLRLKGRREYEQEQQASAPLPAPEDYGMVEWDADRCWW